MWYIIFMEKIRYYSVNKYLQDMFGCKVYKIALNGGFTCPNRDGSIGYGGCIFCSEGGSGEFAGKPSLSIQEQILSGKEFIKKKLPQNQPVKYIAYFQAFTGTYAPVDYLRKIYYEAIEDDEVAVLSIATRPDCISSEVYELLEEINRIKPVWIELGLQTVNEKSVEYIRRGYKNEVYVNCIKKLRNIGIDVITHIILGLPKEDLNDYINTVNFAVQSGTNGIKLQLLHVLKNTDLCRDYEKGLFETLSMDEYIDAVAECLKVIPENVVIHRLTGDGDKKLLVAPVWSADKKRVLNELGKRIEVTG